MLSNDSPTIRLALVVGVSMMALGVLALYVDYFLN